MRVSDVMTEKVQTVRPGQPVEIVRDLMRGKALHHLAVTDGGRLVGILSSRDLDGRGRAAGATVADVMTRRVVTVTPSTPVKRAAGMMRGRSIGCLLVTSGDRLVGIVTTSDLLDLLANNVIRPIERGKRWTLKHRVPHVKRSGAFGVW